MPQTSESHAGGCYCGKVRYQILTAPVWAGHCHCRSCQLALGAAFATWAKVAAKDFVVTDGAMKTCQKTPGITRGFCGDCGTSLTYFAAAEVDGQDWSGDAWFSAITLDDPSIVAPSAHIFVSHRQPWLSMNDGLKEFPEF